MSPRRPRVPRVPGTDRAPAPSVPETTGLRPGAVQQVDDAAPSAAGSTAAPQAPVAPDASDLAAADGGAEVIALPTRALRPETGASAPVPSDSGPEAPAPEVPADPTPAEDDTVGQDAPDRGLRRLLPRRAAVLRGSSTPRSAAGPRAAPAPRSRARASADARAEAEARRRAPLPEPVPARQITGRSLFVLAALLLAAVLIAPTLRMMLNQQLEIAAAQEEIAAQEQKRTEYEETIRRWDDPEYVAQQARDRLDLVMPGETLYSVTNMPGEDAGQAPADADPAALNDRLPWAQGLWDSAVRAATDPAPLERTP